MKLTKEQLKQMIAETLNELDYSATDFRDDPKLGQYPGQVTTYHEKHYKWAKRGSDNEYYENDMWPVRKIANMLPQNKPLDSNLYSKASLVGQAPIIIRDPDVALKISNELKPTFDKKFNKYYQLTSGMPKGFTLDDGWLPAQFHPEVAKMMSDRIASSKGVPYGTEPIDRGDAEKEMMKATDTTARVRVPESKFKLSKKQLQQIIKEELAKVLNEGDGTWTGPGWYTLERGRVYEGPFDSEDAAYDSIPSYLEDELSVEEWKQDPNEIPQPAADPLANFSPEEIAAARARAAAVGLEENKK
jgi:hypothetical protein